MFVLPGFEIARAATDRPDLQLRMQGNAFLGAFFAVSPMLEEFGISREQFHEVVRQQYVKKFGRFGDAVVASNMAVMTQGFERIREVPIGSLDAADRSSLRGLPLLPLDALAAACRHVPVPEGQPPRSPFARVAVFDAEFRGGLGYHQPASPLASVGIAAAATGDTASKYVARRETPLYFAENCTQCMECIAVCPDTALPNCAQDLSTILRTAVSHYVEDVVDRETLLRMMPDLDARLRAQMRDAMTSAEPTPLPTIIRGILNEMDGVSAASREQLLAILDKVPMAYSKANAIFGTPERRHAGDGGVFSIFVSISAKAARPV
jgi:pyruvate-ferredoxin/flavodoxin oxidoreductase